MRLFAASAFSPEFTAALKATADYARDNAGRDAVKWVDPHNFHVTYAFLGELDAKTAGAVLGKRPGAVRSAAHRGLTTLARRLESRPASLVEVRDTFVPPGAEGVR